MKDNIIIAVLFFLLFGVSLVMTIVSFIISVYSAVIALRSDVINPDLIGICFIWGVASIIFLGFSVGIKESALR